jgi:Ca-activated chloride channel family protein
MDSAGTAGPKDPVAGLIDIPLPNAVSFWPETWLSRAVIVLLVVAIIAGLWWYLHRRKINRYRRAAIAELDRILRDPNVGQRPAATVDALALLVRRTALAVCPRETIVSLTGSEWLNFLDRSYDGHQFTQGPGRILGASLYEHREFAAADVGSLGDLVRQWIHKHHV